MAASGKIVVIGGGGREHAIAWSLSSSGVPIVVSPGNGGVAGMPNVTTAPYTTAAAAVEQCRGARVVVVGPEAPLAEGLSDALQAAGIPCFGPTRAAAQLETSKAWCKAFLQRHGIPTAAYKSFRVLGEAEAFIRAAPFRCVVKASGLCAGKGVVVARDVEEALEAARSIMGGAFGEAGAEVVIEEFLEGEEASVLAFSDGKTVAPLPAAQDHKRAWEFDQGALPLSLLY
jgi:phosphoribosylamine--glycine ligase